MKYYKVICNRKVVDTISGDLRYIKYQLKHKVPLLCPESEAEGIIADSGNIYHISSCLPFPVNEFPSATIEEITKSEYEQLVRLCHKTAEEIMEDIMMDLIKRGVI